MLSSILSFFRGNKEKQTQEKSDILQQERVRSETYLQQRNGSDIFTRVVNQEPIWNDTSQRVCGRSDMLYQQESGGMERGRGRGNSGRERGTGRKRWIEGYYTGRMYGRFQCAGCKKKWESSNVYMVEGKEGVYYEQQCKACHTSMQPYQAEPIRCRQCGEENCICDDFEQRHVDTNKPHRSDLCERCKSGRPCRQAYGYN